jgi:hypothetical protein
VITRLRGRSPALLLVVVSGLLSACSLTFDASSLGVPVTMASAANAPAQGASFKVSSHATYAFWGVVKLSEPSLRKALATQLVGAGGVADLRIRLHSRFPDFLVTVLTLGLIIPRTVTFEGIVVEGK